MNLILLKNNMSLFQRERLCGLFKECKELVFKEKDEYNFCNVQGCGRDKQDNSEDTGMIQVK